MKILKIIFFILAIIFLPSCQRHTVPKPVGYFRIAIPDTSYSNTTLDGYPYAFRVSNNAYIEDQPHEGESFWINIQYPMLNATIHCSYKPIQNNFRTLSHDAQEFLYKHTTIASAIPVQEFANPDNQVWGLFCELHGNTATPMQFVLDSVGGLPIDTGKVVAGGPMMGKAVSNLNAPVTKGTSGILVMNNKESKREEMENCIRCGKCVEVCCMGLQPYLMMKLAEKAMWKEAEEEAIYDCLECGSCSYICPSHRPLLDYVRFGKSKVMQIRRERNLKE